MTGAPDSFRLEFELRTPARLPALQRVFGDLQRIKAIQFSDDDDDDVPPDWREPEDPHWTSLLDDAAVAHFRDTFDYASEEGDVYQALWALTRPEHRNLDIFNLPGPWGFDSVVDAIYSGEYLLTKLAATGPRSGVLIYDPLAGPFGGTEAMVQLIEGFGQFVVFDSWHNGPHHRPTVGWDVERARQLVAAGTGAA